MKAKFIYEALDFERGLDPKTSMNIGMDAKLDAWLQSNYGIKPSSDKIALEYAVMGNNLEFVKYLIGVKKTEVSQTAINLAFKNRVDDEIRLWLVTKGDQSSMDYLQKATKKALGESINFERGKDPRDSMKIGIRNKRSFKTIRECAQFFIDNIDKLSEGRFKDANDLKRAFQDQGYAAQKMDPNNPSSTRSPLRMSKDYLDGFIERDALGNTINHKYPSMHIEEWGTSFDQLLEKLKGLRDFHIDLQRILGIHKEQYISESVNFERGIDPKAAMQLGWRARIIQWFNEPHAFEDFFNGFYDLLPKKINRFTTDHWLIRHIAKFVGHSGKDEITPEQFADLLSIILYSNAGKETDEVFKFSKYEDINGYDDKVTEGHLDETIYNWLEEGVLTDLEKFKKELEEFPNKMYEGIQNEEEEEAEEEKTDKRISN